MPIRVSSGTAAVLGLKSIRVDAAPTTAYLMAGERCAHACAFCPQSRDAGSRGDLLSRVTWSEYDEGVVAGEIGKAVRGSHLKRVCFQVVHSKEGLDEARSAMERLRGESDIPVCVSSVLGTIDEVGGLLAMGADRVSIPLDAATEEVYRRTKTGSFQRTLDLIREAAKAYPGRISTHLIAGLGESEEDCVRRIAEMVELGVTVGLFAFTPVRGTRLEGYPQPGLASYRRIQAAHYLVREGLVRLPEIGFGDGRIVRYGVDLTQLREYLAGGKAFRTSGCPDCNRPYYNERPGGVFYNYPRPLTEEESAEAVQLVLGSVEPYRDEPARNLEDRAGGGRR